MSRRIQAISAEEYKAAVRDSWSEEQFTRIVIALAKEHGWLCAHFRPGRTANGGWKTAVQGDGAGFPDLLLIQPCTGAICAAELKVGRGKPTEKQRIWLGAFSAAGVPAYIWFPSDYDDLVQVLTQKEKS